MKKDSKKMQSFLENDNKKLIVVALTFDYFFCQLVLPSSDLDDYRVIQIYCTLNSLIRGAIWGKYEYIYVSIH